jgi:hypothetical protein
MTAPGDTHSGIRQQRSSVAVAPVAGWLLLLLTTVLTVSQWELVAMSAVGHDNSLRDTGAAIVLGLAGLRISLSPGPHPIATGLAGLAGTGLVVAGLLADHDHQALAVIEMAAGCLAAFCCVTAAVSPSARR